MFRWNFAILKSAEFGVYYSKNRSIYARFPFNTKIVLWYQRRWNGETRRSELNSPLKGLYTPKELKKTFFHIYFYSIKLSFRNIFEQFHQKIKKQLTKSFEVDFVESFFFQTIYFNSKRISWKRLNWFEWNMARLSLILLSSLYYFIHYLVI